MKSQQGLTLIEMMLTVTISLIIIIGVLNFWVNTNQSTRFHENLSLAQENGRHSLYLMTRDARIAGYRSGINLGVLIPFYQGACNGFVTCTFDGGGTNSDQVAIQYEPVTGEDCAGNAVPAGEITADVYFIDNDPANNNIDSLFCQGVNPATAAVRGPALPLIQGVENLQVLYGVSSTGTDIIDQYQIATSVTDWENVRNVRFGVLVNAGLPGMDFERRTRVFNVLESGTQTFFDNTPRYIYETSVRLNNTGI